jgi:hypothetical protein
MVSPGFLRKQKGCSDSAESKKLFFRKEKFAKETFRFAKHQQSKSCKRAVAEKVFRLLAVQVPSFFGTQGPECRAFFGLKKPGEGITFDDAMHWKYSRKVSSGAQYL